MKKIILLDEEEYNECIKCLKSAILHIRGKPNNETESTCLKVALSILEEEDK